MSNTEGCVRARGFEEGSSQTNREREGGGGRDGGGGGRVRGRERERERICCEVKMGEVGLGSGAVEEVVCMGVNRR